MQLVKKLLLLFVVIALALPCAAKAGQASFGFGIKIEGEGFFLNPILKHVSVSGITAGSPAQKAGLLVGDALITANDVPIEGARAKTMSDLMHSLNPGDHLRLKVRRTGGAIAVIDIIAGTR